MQSIKATVEINAEPEAVFDLISRMQEFPRFAPFLKEVRVTGPETSHWTAEVLGIWLEWDSVVTECERPKRFAWQSTTGATNKGRYVLERAPGGTNVSFVMEYQFPSPFIEMTVGHLADRVVRRYVAKVLARVKKQLEQPNVTKRPSRLSKRRMD